MAFLTKLPERVSNPLQVGNLPHMVWAVLAFACCAPAEPLPETQVKAAFVLNFTKFIEWPPEAFRDERAPFAICILGENTLGDALVKAVRGETVGGRPIVIERIHRPPEPKTCQAVVAGGTERGVAKTLVGLGPGVLTIGEGETFVREGGMIGFIIENRHVRFDINQAAAMRSQLIMSARLLSVARTVQR